MTFESGSAHRFAFLDSLRGFAALYVVLCHMTFLSVPSLVLPHWLSDFIKMSASGVTLFFIVSAFSLSYTSLKHARDGTGLAGFYVRRFFRIAPLLYVMIFFHLYQISSYHVYFGIWDIVKNMLFVFNFFPGLQDGIVPASWTIGVEMAFYAIFPFMLRWCSNLHRITVFVVASLLIAAAFHEVALYIIADKVIRNGFLNFSIFTKMPVFAFGMMVYALFTNYINGKQLPRTLGVLLIVSAAYLYCALWNGKLDFLFINSEYWQSVIYGSLLLGLAIYPLSLLVNRVTIYLGRISYSIYLLHPLIVGFMLPIYQQIYKWHLPTTFKFAGCALLTWGVVIGVGSITYRIIELPGVRIGNRVLALIRQRREIPISLGTAMSS